MKSLNIGIVAYGVDPSMVFVRVPNERGRWMLTHRSVVEVDCPFCNAISGEPCRQMRSRWKSSDTPHDPIRYHVGTHVARKGAWREVTGLRSPEKRAGPYKLRLTAADLAELQSTPPTGLVREIEPVDIDFEVTRRK
jgi:hypothetical protein